MSPLAVLVSSVTLLAAMAGCVPEDFGGHFYIVNDSDQGLYFATTRIDPDGGLLSISVKGCGDPGLVLYDGAGAVMVTVDEKWCEEYTLTVRGPGEYTLVEEEP